MIKKLFRSLAAFALASVVTNSVGVATESAPTTPPAAIPNVFAHPHLSLNGKWHTIVDPYDTGYYSYRRTPYDATNPPSGGFGLDQKAKSPADLVEYDFSKSPTLLVPRDWNSQEDRLFYYEGSVWYQRTFDYRPSAPGKRAFVYFGAANYQADVYLNGRKLGTHVGGFTPFNFEITDLVKETDNTLVVRVNNRRLPEGVPTESTDWWNYGGLTRDVLIVETPATYISDYSVRLLRGATDRIAVTVRQTGANAAKQAVRVAIPELGIDAQLTPGTDSTANIELPVDAAKKLALWSPEAPKLYDVTLSTNGERITDKIGFRTIETRGPDILLNGKSVFLRGICIHEENPIRGGRAWSEEDARMLLGWARELGCNFVRLAHYPHNEHMARVADEFGLMLWEEIPVYWTVQFENPDVLANARNQLAELIHRDHNRASVIVWSVANETPPSEPRTRFLRTLIDDARALDNSRLVSCAMEIHNNTDKDRTDGKVVKVVNDPLGEFTDLISFNQYVGWYDGTPEKCDRIIWDIRFNKPVFVSEFGADALEGNHGAKKARFTEEYQADVYRKTFPMLERMANFRGCTPWILADFRSPRRPLPNIQDGWNRKGLIGESGTRKEAFYILRDYYTQKAEQSK